MGTGMKFPIQINPASGRFLESEGAESVRESVYLILMTQKGERAANPEFGSRLLSYPFLETSPTRLHMLEREVHETLLRQEPRISEVEVRAEPDLKKGELVLYVDYKLRNTGEQDSLHVKV